MYVLGWNGRRNHVILQYFDNLSNQASKSLAVNYRGRVTNGIRITVGLLSKRALVLIYSYEN